MIIGRSTNTIRVWCISPLESQSTTDKRIIVNVLNDIKSGHLTGHQISAKYNISKCPINNWRTNYTCNLRYETYKNAIRLVGNQVNKPVVNDIPMNYNNIEIKEPLVQKLIKCITREDVKMFDKIVISFVGEGVNIETSVKPINSTQTFTIP